MMTRDRREHITNQAKERAEAKRASRKLGTTVRARTKPELGPRVSAAPAADVSLPSSGADGGPTGTFAVAALAAAGQVNVRGRGSVQAPGVTKAAAAALAGFHTAGAGNGRGRGGRLDEAVGQKQQQQEVEKPVVLDELFRKTQAKPSLYWLPLSEEEVGERARVVMDCFP